MTTELAHRMDIEVAKPQSASNAITPMDMLNRAIETGANMDMLEKLMALQERWEANQARKAFDEAMAAAKAEISPIVKTATGHNQKKYADFASIARAVDPIISEHGLSYRFRSEQQDSRILVTCILSHKAGHQEETTLGGPADTSGSKNAIQAIGSTLTYLQRYSLVQALGLAAANDDDGRTTQETSSPIGEPELKQLRALIEETDTDIASFCKYLNVEALPDLTTAQMPRALAALNKKKGRANA